MTGKPRGQPWDKLHRKRGESSLSFDLKDRELARPEKRSWKTERRVYGDEPKTFHSREEILERLKKIPSRARARIETPEDAQRKRNREDEQRRRDEMVRQEAERRKRQEGSK